MHGNSFPAAAMLLITILILCGVSVVFFFRSFSFFPRSSVLMFSPGHDMRVFPSAGFLCFNLACGFEYGEIRIPGISCLFWEWGLGSLDLLFLPFVCLFFFLVFRFFFFAFCPFPLAYLSLVPWDCNLDING